MAGLAALMVFPADAGNAADQTLRIGWTAWASSEATARLAARVLGERLGYEVELVLATTPFLYAALAKGDLDVFLASWQPHGHRDHLAEVGRRVDDYGPLYTGARLGLAVPEGLVGREVGAIGDLRRPGARRRLRGIVRGVDPGTGLMQRAAEALRAYGLEGYTLEPSSDAGAAAAIERALRTRRPVVVTARKPHWMFDVYGLRYLADPRGAFGGRQRVHKLTRTGFADDHPWASRVLGRMVIGRDTVARLIAAGRARGYARAAARFTRRNAARVRYWVTGKIDAAER